MCRPQTPKPLKDIQAEAHAFEVKLIRKALPGKSPVFDCNALSVHLSLVASDALTRAEATGDDSGEDEDEDEEGMPKEGDSLQFKIEFEAGDEIGIGLVYAQLQFHEDDGTLNMNGTPFFVPTGSSRGKMAKCRRVKNTSELKVYFMQHYKNLEQEPGAHPPLIFAACLRS